MAKRKGKGAAEQAAPEAGKEVTAGATPPATEPAKEEQVAAPQVASGTTEGTETAPAADTAAPEVQEPAPVLDAAAAAPAPEVAQPSFPARYVVRNNSPAPKAFPVIDTIVAQRSSVTVTITTESKYRRLMTDVKQLTELAGNPHLITVKPAIEN